MPNETLLLLNEHDGQYFIGTQKLVKSRIRDVTMNLDHVHDAAVFHGLINLDMNPLKLAKSGSEHGEQRAVFCWLNYCAQWYPDFEWAYAAANGGSRGDTDQSRKIAGGMMKAEGVKAGVPDFMMPTPRFHVGYNTMFAGLYIEMKDANGGDGGSERQREYLTYLNSVGYAAQICNGWLDAIAAIALYFELKRRVV